MTGTLLMLLLASPTLTVNSKLRKHKLGIKWAENWLDYWSERIVISSLTH